jgi:hypothetical protein
LKTDIDNALDRAFEKVRCTETLQETLLAAGAQIPFVETNQSDILILLDTNEDRNENLFGNSRQMFKRVKSRKQRRKEEASLEERLKVLGSTPSVETPVELLETRDSLGEYADIILEDENQFVVNASLFSIEKFYNVFDTISDDKGTFDPEEEAFILTILNLLFGSRNLDGSSDWSVFRLFPEGIPLVEKVIGGTINFLETVQETLEAFGKKILKAIAAIEDKIKRIQQIINIINMLLELLKGFTLELGLPLHALAHVANGTDDLVAKLVSSGMKPSSPNDNETYAAGMLVVAGGLPSILVEFLVKMLVSEEE